MEQTPANAIDLRQTSRALPAGATALTLAVDLTLDSAWQGTLVELVDADARPVVRLIIRTAGTDRATAEWDRLQNYAAYAAASDGAVPVLECEILTEPPLSRIEMLRAEHEKRAVSGQDFIPDADMIAGRLRLGVPLSLLGPGNCHVIVVRISPAHVELLVDGTLLDEEWPAGALQGQTGLKILQDPESIVERVATWPALREDSEIARLGLNANRIGATDQTVIAHFDPITQYWVPPGHNCRAGDAMLTADGDERLHLFWLFDRRMGTSKFGCGAHQFAHASTADLIHWDHHPMAAPITEPWEASNGTGCVVKHSGGYALFTNVLTSRLGPSVASRHPEGLYLWNSLDGIEFKKQGYLGFGGEPGIVQDDNGIFHAVASARQADGIYRTVRMESADLQQWHFADANFLPSPGWPPTREVFSSECFCWFRWRDWWYIIGGRTGFWRSKNLRGPYSGTGLANSGAPRWDIYDGLMVPEATVFRDRCILAGWLPFSTKDFAGHMVFRELLQQPDGELQLRRLLEMEPAIAKQTVAEMTVDGSQGLHFAPLQFDHSGDVRLQLQLKCDATTDDACFGLRLFGSADDEDGVELRFEPSARRAQWGTPRKGRLAAPASSFPFDGADFAILGVDGLDRLFKLDIILHIDDKSRTLIADAQLDQRRTMITRRHQFAAGRGVVFARSCVLHLVSADVQ